jgi:hypothetical protein
MRLFPVPDPTGQITLWLYWQPLAQTALPLKVFVHLTGEVNPATGSPLWAQADAPPQQGRVQTSTWQPGELYRDVIILPVGGLPPGTYTLSTGLYDPATGVRLPLAGGGDALPLAQITLP